MTKETIEMNDSELINQLQQASEGLLWMSEADYPFEAFVWEETTVTPELLLRRTGHSPNTPVETVGVDEFFCHCTTEGNTLSGGGNTSLIQGLKPEDIVAKQRAASFKLAPSKLAPSKLALTKLASSKLAPSKFAPSRLAPIKLALFKLAASKLA